MGEGCADITGTIRAEMFKAEEETSIMDTQDELIMGKIAPILFESSESLNCSHKIDALG